MYVRFLIKVEFVKIRLMVTYFSYQSDGGDHSMRYFFTKKIVAFDWCVGTNSQVIVIEVLSVLVQNVDLPENVTKVGSV